MVNYTFNDSIPASNNNPSDDQPLMLTNNQNLPALLSVDHVSFNENNGGTHKQITFIGKNTPAAQTDPSSVQYTGSGTASTVADLFFVNQNGTFKVNPLRSFGVFQTVNVNGAVSLVQSQNVTSVTSSTNGRVYTIAIPVNIITGTNVMILLNLANDGTKTWSFTANTLTVSIDNSSTGSVNLSFFIFQL